MISRNIMLSMISILLLTTSCADFSRSFFGSEPSSRAEKPSIDESYAALRNGQLANISYQLSIDLTKKDRFDGLVKIKFELRRNDIPVTIDFSGGEIAAVQLNGKDIPYHYNGWFISIDPANLVIGKQSVSVEYSQAYSKTGSGLYRFVDPEDGRSYVYSDFEPYDANHMFPSFDQPDLKASYVLDVIAPTSWNVISSARENKVVKAKDSSHWYFDSTAIFSTYIFSLHAGDYAMWNSMAGDIPLRLFSRQSLKKYVVAEDWFAPTRRGFQFFQQYFGLDYPFVKYDQIIVPDFNAGAMENVAAVTFSERFIKRGSYTQNDRDRINSVILHEMAHMWFGDLVTMRWWNGLWLNESFATYMSYLAEDSGPNRDRAWLRFFLNYKLWAYETDEQVISHAIELPVANSDSAFANFDGITYGKGASVLKQLSLLLGPEVFRKGVSQYLQQQAYENTELSDFINTLAKVANRDLKQWAEQWLFQRGVNGLEVDYECRNGMIVVMDLKQSPSAYSNILREHQLQLALYKQGRLEFVSDVALKGETTTALSVLDKPCPDFVYPNYDDWGFIKVILPEHEQAILATSIQEFENPLTRAMLWRNLWEGVRDQRVSLSDYADTLFSNIGKEDNPNILLKLLQSVNAVFYFYTNFGDEGLVSIEEYGRQYEKIAWSRVEEVLPASDVQKYWFDSLVKNTRSTDGLMRLAQLLNGELEVDALNIDQDRRWAIIKRLSAYGFPLAVELYQREQRRDSSAKGAKALLGAKAAAPGFENKSEWLKELLDQSSKYSLADKKSIMRNFLQGNQRKERKQLLSNILAPLPLINEQAQHQYLSAYGQSLVKGYCEEESVAMLLAAIRDNPTAKLKLKKSLRVALQDDRRCIGIKIKNREYRLKVN